MAKHPASEVKIGLLGGSGLIGQDLAAEAPSLGIEVEIFSRSSGPLGTFQEYSSLRDFEDLDALVNLVGGHKAADFESTAEDQLRIDNLASAWAVRMDRPYIYMSSGSIFEKGSFPVNSSTPVPKEEGFATYSSLKRFIENRHNEARKKGVPISDLRLFSFSGERFIRDGGYFLSQIFASCQSGSRFTPRGDEFTRDYVGSAEIWQAVLGICNTQSIPKFNLFSGSPINRNDVFEIFAVAFPSWIQTLNESPTRDSDLYYACSENQLPCYSPRSSHGAIQNSLKSLLG
jgi:nucleoside-diphosphate-sugar epimerase